MISHPAPDKRAQRVDLAGIQDFDLGRLRVSPAHRQVEMDGQQRELEPRVAQVLVALSLARPAVVSRERLIEQCWDGRIVGDDALNRCILALRHLAKDFSPQPFAIQTVPRVGYALVEGPDGAEFRPWSRSFRRTTSGLILGAIFLMSIVGGFYLWRSARSGAQPTSIAVLPFRNLSNGDSYFAEGVSEEILGQLAREPAFQVAGRGAAAQFSGPYEPRDAGQRLGVDYLLEGSVRSVGGRVRINASLVQARDGKRLWSETYDRRLEDILEIQASIGQAVAGELRRRLIHSPSGRAINGEAYALYLNGRGMLRSGNPQSGGEAAATFQKAVRLDPRYAPAWSSLAEALYLDARTKGLDGMIEALPNAQAAARRALHIDPNLASAHGVLGQLVGYETREGAVHLQRAADLAPKTSEGQFWRSIGLRSSDDLVAARRAVREAHQLDPSWQVATRALVDTEAEMGDRKAAESAVRSGFADDPMIQQFALARVAWFFGDFSEAARHFVNVAKSQGRWAKPAQRSLGDLKYMLKLTRELPESAPVASVGQFSRYVPKVWTLAAPSSAEWQRRNRSWNAGLVYLDENVVAAKLMLNAGRAKELSATYDSPSGLLGLRRGVPVSNCQFQEAALVALALKAVGRNAEAHTILRQANALLRAAIRRGSVPVWFEDDAAQYAAIEGRTADAVRSLERSLNRGWVHAGRTDLAIEDEPAFRPLHEDRRFQAIQLRLAKHFTRERQETVHILD